MGYDYYDVGCGYTPDNEPKVLRKGVFSKIILILIIVTILVYTGVVLFINANGGVVQSELTCSFFGVELISLVVIKVTKVREEKENAVYRDYGADAEEKRTGTEERRAGIPEADTADQQDAGGLRL